MSNWQGLERQGASAPTDFSRLLRVPPMPQEDPANAPVQEDHEEQEDPRVWVEEWLAPPGTYVRERRRPQFSLAPDPAAPAHRKRAPLSFLQKGSFGLSRAGKDQAEELARQYTAAIQRQFPRPMNVVIANPHGGSGATTCAVAIAGTFGTLRGGSVLAWDTHEAFGSMGVRTAPNGGSRTVIDLLADSGNFDRIDARAGDLGGYWRAQPGAFFDVLVSDQDPKRSLEFGAEDFHRIHQLVTRFRDLVILDTGNNTRRPNFLAATQVCDQLVIPTTIGQDSLWAVSMLIDQLEAMGREDLVSNAIVVLTDTTPTDRTNPGRQNALDWLGSWAAAVVEVPHDGHLAARSTIDYRLLTQPARDAFLKVSALIAEGLTSLDPANPPNVSSTATPYASVRPHGSQPGTPQTITDHSTTN